MKAINVGTKFKSNPDAYLSTDMSRNRTYTILSINNDVLYWKDDVGDVRSAHVELFHDRYLTVPPAKPGLYVGATVRCVSRGAAHGGPRSTFRDMTIGNQYLINRLDEEYVGWVDDLSVQCTAMRSYADACFSPIVPNEVFQDEADAGSGLEISLMQTLMKASGFIINPAQAQVILDMACVYAKSIGETV